MATPSSSPEKTCDGSRAPEELPHEDGVIQDIVTTVSKELNAVLPVLLAPLLEELGELRRLNLKMKWRPDEESVAVGYAGSGTGETESVESPISKLVGKSEVIQAPGVDADETAAQSEVKEQAALKEATEESCDIAPASTRRAGSSRVFPAQATLKGDQPDPPANQQNTGATAQGAAAHEKILPPQRFIDATDSNSTGAVQRFHTLDPELIHQARTAGPSPGSNLVAEPGSARQLSARAQAAGASDEEECTEVAPTSTRRAWLPHVFVSRMRFRRHHAYERLLNESQNEDDPAQVANPEVSKQLSEEIASLEAEEAAALRHLNELEHHWESRRKPYESDVASIREELKQKREQLEIANMQVEPPAPPPPGPEYMRFVESYWFHVACTLVVLLNLAAWTMQPYMPRFVCQPELTCRFFALDNVFLTWYIFELGAKAYYYQGCMFFGSLGAVWWSWLDLCVVIGGLLDLWFMPLLIGSMNEKDDYTKAHALLILRFSRLFRLLRFLKLLRPVLKSNIILILGPAFQTLMASVLVINSITLALELDVPWEGWVHVERCCLIAYSIELAFRLKGEGWQFFVDLQNIGWNYVEFAIVVGGALDQWIVPFWLAIQEIPPDHPSASDATAIRLVKLTRLLRILRLLRLLKVVKPLYTMLLGVMQSLRGMQWVMTLTILTLYACSILFTNLIGRGLVSGGQVTKEMDEVFGSVSKSCLSLFKLMNGDTSVAEPIESVPGQLTFVGIVTVANWAILAIITSVMSDHMISSSQRQYHEDQLQQREVNDNARSRLLSAIFSRMDLDSSGCINAAEWASMMTNRTLRHQLGDATGLTDEELNEYFHCLATDSRHRRMMSTSTSLKSDMELDYNTFLDTLAGGTGADKKSILRVMSQLRSLESRVFEKMEKIEDMTVTQIAHTSVRRGLESGRGTRSSQHSFHLI